MTFYCQILQTYVLALFHFTIHNFLFSVISLNFVEIFSKIEENSQFSPIYVHTLVTDVAYFSLFTKKFFLLSQLKDFNELIFQIQDGTLSKNSFFGDHKGKKQVYVIHRLN